MRVILLRKSRRTISMAHIHTTWPRASEKCSSKGWSHGAGTVPIAGIRTTWNRTHKVKPHAAPCHSFTFGCFSAIRQ